MKQSAKKSSKLKTPISKTADAAKTAIAAKADPALLQKANQFHRFLEASCDCV